jgi:hypothetical protein
MRFPVLALATAVMMQFSLVAGAAADKDQAPKEVLSEQYNTRVGKVLEINEAKRHLVVQGESGMKWDVTASPQVKNFSQIKKGDMIKIQTTDSVAITLTKKEKGEKPSAEVATIKTSAPAGSKPSAEAMEMKEITAEVVKVDAAKGWIELKGPLGNTLAMKAKNPANLEGVKKGDMIAATFTEEMAISVEPATK